MLLNREDFLGEPQRKAVDFIDSQVEKGEHLPLLITGPSGVGKTSLALYYANKVNGQPTIDQFNCSGSFNKPDVDALVAKIHLKPMFQNFSVLFFDEIHGLSTQAQNALLVPMEPLPPHVIMIAATTEISKLIKSLVSRMFRIDLPPPPKSEVLAYLKQHVPEDVAKQIYVRYALNMREMQIQLRTYLDRGELLESVPMPTDKEPALFTRIVRCTSFAEVIPEISKVDSPDKAAADLAFYCFAVLKEAKGRRDKQVHFALSYIKMYGHTGLPQGVPPLISFTSLLYRAYAAIKAA